MSKNRRHLFSPDTQVKPGVPTDHLAALGKYIARKQPEVIVHAGDHFDMPSLSSYDRGTKKAEGARYKDDIDAGIAGMDVLFKPIRALQRRQEKAGKPVYKPELHFTLGNHEERIMRHVNYNPELEGQLSYKDLQLESYGWKVHDFLKPVRIDGVSYIHYVPNPMTGKPIGGMAATRIKTVGYSFCMGHQQTYDIAVRHLGNGQVIRALIAGAFYMHDEEYKGPTGNEHWRGCVMLNGVKDGDYSLMELDMNYLLEKYGVSK